jgi:conjugative transposon TraM protein
MKRVQLSQAFLRKRKMMLVLPLLVIPFLTMAFWALGGGGSEQTTNVAKQPGLNLNLPDAGLKDDNMLDKLSFYEKADRDSIKLEEFIRNDPYYKKGEDTTQSFSNELEHLTESTASKYNQRLNTSPYEVADNNAEQKLIQKLATLEKEMNKQTEEKNEDPSKKYLANQKDDFTDEVDRLENMMQVMSKPAEDIEMQQLSGTLDKILDIQHPQRIKDRIKEKSLKQKEVVFTVSKDAVIENISLLDTVKRKNITATGFYGIDNVPEDDNNGIEAVVHANQVLVNGAVIKLRLTTDIYINGTLIPKDNFVFGIASLNNERLEVAINSIRNDKALFTVKLEVFDMDGLPGIYIPGAITRDVAKQSADNGLQLMELTSVDPSLKAQAAATGITAAKSLLSKKIKQVKVTVKAGYKVLLKDKNVQQ